MLIRKEDIPLSDSEWRTYLKTHNFGQLIAGGGTRRAVPAVVPAHFHYDGMDSVLLHLARANPIWEAIEENSNVLLAVVGSYTYIPSAWNAAPRTPDSFGIPTSYYAAVQLTCEAEVIDQPSDIAEVLNLQRWGMGDDTSFEPVTPTNAYGPHLAAIRAMHLTIRHVNAKFKFGGNRGPDHERDVISLLRQRKAENDLDAADHKQRRLGLTSAARTAVTELAQPNEDDDREPRDSPDPRLPRPDH